MIKYFKNRFINKIMNYYDYQILSLSIEIGYNDKYSEQEIDSMINKINKFDEIVNALKYILVDLNNNRF